MSKSAKVSDDAKASDGAKASICAKATKSVNTAGKINCAEDLVWMNSANYSELFSERHYKLVRKAVSLVSSLAISMVSIVSNSIPARASASLFERHPVAEEIKAEPRAKWAVLVGVVTPGDETFGTMRGAADNVAAIEACLKNLKEEKFANDHIVTLVGEQATKAAIEDAITLKWLSHKALPNDMIVLYFAGKVLPSSDHADAVFCTTDITSVQPSFSGIELKRLLDDLRVRTQCKEIICFLDTSPSDLPAAKAALTASDITRVEDIAQDCRISVLSANQLFQVSHVDNVSGNSLFCHYLIDGIESDGGQLPLSAVAKFVIESINRDAQKVHKSQLPIFAVAKDAQGLSELPLEAPTKVGSAKHTIAGYSMAERPDLFRQTEAPQIPGDGVLINEPTAEPQTDAMGIYTVQMRKDIQAKWKTPKTFPASRIIALFRLNHDGSVDHARIIEGTGVPEIDNSALSALLAASPFAPLPSTAPDSMQVRYKFDW